MCRSPSASRRAFSAANSSPLGTTSSHSSGPSHCRLVSPLTTTVSAAGSSRPRALCTPAAKAGSWPSPRRVRWPSSFFSRTVNRHGATTTRPWPRKSGVAGKRWLCSCETPVLNSVFRWMADPVVTVLTSSPASGAPPGRLPPESAPTWSRCIRCSGDHLSDRRTPRKRSPPRSPGHRPRARTPARPCA